MEFIYPVFTRMAGGATVGDSSLCYRVLCLSSVVISLRLFIDFFFVCAKSLTFSFYFDLFYVLDELVLRMLAALKQWH